MSARLIDRGVDAKRTIQAVCDDDGWRGGVYPYEGAQAHYEANWHNADVHGIGPFVGRKSKPTSRVSATDGDD